MGHRITLFSRKTAVSFRQVRGVTVAKLEGSEVTRQVGKALGDHLQSQRSESGNAPRYVLNLHRLKFLSSVGVNVLLMFMSQLKEHGGQIVLADLDWHCMHVIKTLALSRVFNICPDVHTALEALEQDAVMPLGDYRWLERRQDSERRTEPDRRKAQCRHEGPDRRSGKDRRAAQDRRDL